MKNVSKLLSVIGVFCSTVALCACGNQGSKTKFNFDDLTTYEFDTSKKVDITFYHTMGQNLQQVLDIYLEDFNAMYPNINVSHTAIGSYDDVRDQMTTQISAGASSCDLSYCYPDHVAMYNKAKSLVPLNYLINSEVELNGEKVGFTEAQIADFTPAYYEEGNCFGDGEMYCLPFSKSSEVLYYDATFFEEKGITVPTTWDEMENACRRIKEIDPDSIPLGYDSSSNWFITMCEQLGTPYTSATGEHYLFNNQANKDFVKKIKGWYDNGYVTTKVMYGSYTSGLFTAKAGETRCYMCIGSSAGSTYQRPELSGDSYRFETGITQIPQANKDAPKVISQGPDICIFNSKDKQKIMASWLLAKFLTTTPEFQAQFSMVSGYTPVISSAFKDSNYVKFLNSADGGKNIAALATKVTVEQQNSYFTSPAFVGSSGARDEVGSLLDSVLAYTGGNLDAEIDSLFEEAINECKKN